MKDPLVSVVVPVGPDAESLGQCLDRLGRQAYERKEVVVVCDPRAEGQVALPEPGDDLKVVRETHPCTLGHLVNSGMRAARGDVKVLLMPHCAPVGESWLQSMVAPFQDDDVGVVVGRCILPEGARRSLALRLLQSVDSPQLTLPPRVPAPAHAVSHLCDAYRADLLREIGYFESEGLNAPGQAVDASIKVAESGRSVVLSSEAVAVHNVPAGGRRLARVMHQALDYGRSDALLDRQYELHWLNAGVFAAALLSLVLVPLGAASLPVAWLAAAALCLWGVFQAVRVPVLRWECPVAVLSVGIYVALVLAVRSDWWASVLGKGVHPAVIRQWCWVVAVAASLLLILLKAAAGTSLRACRQPRGLLYALPVFVLGLVWWLMAGVGYLQERLSPSES